MRKSIELFEAAIAKDPHFALAYAELSTAWAFLGWSAPDGLQNIDLLPHVKAAALKAVELDDRLPAAHLALASVYLNFEFDWPHAEREYKRAIELAPSDARGHSAYAVFLSKMGRFSEALTHAQRASELSQTSATDRMFMFIYFAMRRFDLAERYGLSASRKDDHFLNHMFLGFTYLQEHKYSQGISELEKLRAGGTGGGLAGLAYAYAVGGRTADARLLLKQCTANEQGGLLIVRYRVAAVYLALGDKDKAIEFLRKDYEVRDNWLNWLKVDPIMDPLRSDPRFANLMRLMKFESDTGEPGGELKRMETIYPTELVWAPSSLSGPLTGKMAIYNSLLGPPWACMTQLPAMLDQPPHTETASVTFTNAPRNVLAIEVSGTQFAARNFIGFDAKSNQYWRTEMGVYGGIMRETSADGVNFSGTSTMGNGWEPVRSILTPVQPDGTSSDTEFFTRDGVELKITSVCKR